MRRLLITSLLILVLAPLIVLAQDDDEWHLPSYLRNDYKAVFMVAHVRIQQAGITSRIGDMKTGKSRR